MVTVIVWQELFRTLNTAVTSVMDITSHSHIQECIGTNMTMYSSGVACSHESSLQQVDKRDISLYLSLVKVNREFNNSEVHKISQYGKSNVKVNKCN